MSMTIAEVLEKAADLIEPEGAWMRGGYGNSPELTRASCFCAVGAIASVLRVHPADAERWIKRNRIGTRFLGTLRIEPQSTLRLAPIGQVSTGAGRR